MGLHMLDISPDVIEKIDGLIRLGRYSNLDQFLRAAIRNQILVEQSEDRMSVGNLKPLESSSANILEERIPLANPTSIATRNSWKSSPVGDVSLPAGVPIQTPLWGQFYRYLPLKLSLRVVANNVSADQADLSSLAEILIHEAIHLVRLLEASDVKRKQLGMLALSVGFPNSDESEKSKRRFMTQYIGSVNSSGQLTGFASDMGFLVSNGGVENQSISLTQEGLAFALITNPVLDSGDLSSPLAIEEIDFLLEHVASRMEGERKQMRELLVSISNGSDTPQLLRKRVTEVYSAYYDGTSSEKEIWSEKKVTLMTSGALSRASEMGIVRREHHGRHVKYLLIGNWEAVLKRLN